MDKIAARRDITKVAVMVNPSLAEADEVFALPYIDMVQFHGDEDEEYCGHFARHDRPFIKAIAAKDKASVRNLGRFHTRHILLDGYSREASGGDGEEGRPGFVALS